MNARIFFFLLGLFIGAGIIFCGFILFDAIELFYECLANA